MFATERKCSAVATTLLSLVVLGGAFIAEPSRSAQAAPALADTLNVPPTEALKVSLLEWIGRNSKYDASAAIANPPVVRFCERGKPFTYEGKVTNFDETMRGAYDDVTKEICLAKPWDASKTKDVGVLLHELTHYVQFETRFWACSKNAEWQAYKLQEAWLKERNIDPEFNWVYIFVSSRCSPRDIHP